LERAPRAPSHGGGCSLPPRGVEYNINWVPAASSDDQPASHRVSAMGVGVWGLGEQSALEAAAFLGSHVTGEPIDATRPYVLTAVSLLRRF
jgi:hypothetical protein